MGSAKKVYATEPLMRCPFCGESVHVLKDRDGDMEGLLHERQMCKEFDELDVDDYLAAAKRKGLLN